MIYKLEYRIGSMNNGEVIKRRISDLRGRMQAEGGDICLITDNDAHISEYTGDFYKLREFFSGFTGSAGTLVVAKDDAWLFTDGRYFVQAERELSGSGITLMKSGLPGVPAPVDFIRTKAAEIVRAGRPKCKVLTEGALFKASDGIVLSEDENVELHDDFDTAGNIWTNRPEKKKGEIYPLDAAFTGESAAEKLERIRKKMRAQGCEYHILASLEDVAWALNLRGSDIPCTPVFEAFLLVGEESILFVNEASLSENAVSLLREAKVSTQNYDSIYDYIGGLKLGKGVKVLIDKRFVNFRIVSSLPKEALCFADNPSMLMKAVKNDVEIANLFKVHEDDGLCVTRLMYRVKNAGGADQSLSEAETADYIDGLRAEISDYISLSFPTISAYGANAAMMHYAFDRGESAKLAQGGMYLVDSGGQYLRGTTDVTRTFAVGEAPEEQKRAYTLTIKGVLALSDAVFLKGVSGYGLDILARQFLWKDGIDYRSGTGHGVGYLLNVHEGPNAFRYRYVPGVSDYCELAPGMVTTDEPGVYEEGSFGLRVENELLCVRAFENEYGEFLKFETLTLVPYDRDLILVELLTEHERELINEYHRRVYDVLAPRMNAEEREFLQKYTAEL